MLESQNGHMCRVTGYFLRVEAHSIRCFESALDDCLRRSPTFCACFEINVHFKESMIFVRHKAMIMLRKPCANDSRSYDSTLLDYSNRALVTRGLACSAQSRIDKGRNECRRTACGFVDYL